MEKEESISININEYLSESEKKEIVTRHFEKALDSHFSDMKNIYADSERDRHIGNIYHHIICNEIDKHIPNMQEIITKKVKEAIDTKDLTWFIFQRSNAYGDKDSLAVTYINECINNNKQLILDNVADKIKSFNYDEIIIDKLQGIIEESFSNIYDLFNQLKTK
jgi:hypothetical protein